MRALRIDEPGRVGLTSVAEPEPGAGDVLLRVDTVGFCGSDLTTFRGSNPIVSYPRIPGHEIAATVEWVGREVPAERVRVGAQVTVVPYTACGRCAACRRGRVNTCRDNQTMGVQRDGAMTERVAVPWQKVLSTERLSARDLALVEPLSVGWHAAARARVTPGDLVMVIGCGAVGLGAVAAAAARGAEVVAVDVDDAKLALARLAGASHEVNSRRSELREQLLALGSGEGPDVVIEAVGLPETFVAAVAEVAVAGRVVYIGYAKAPVSYDSSQFVRKELDVLGSRNATEEDFAGVIQLLTGGRFPSERVVTRTVPLDEAAEALRGWDADPNRVTRIHVEIG
jgi:2-desacetyl-2-hydroxyethyl bacteriochlorophyllide A dehydrogenase